MQILLINDVLYGILSGAYSTVARIYSIMLDLAGVTSGDRTLELGVIGSFSNITTAIYTIAGVFMLFRVTIAMINMLINPDMVSDRNAGAGKILTRVITSVAMLIIFIPNGWVFGDNGILNRLERGLLAEDGLINRILPSGVSGSDTSTSTTTNNTASSNNSSTTAEQAEAAGNSIIGGIDTVKDIADQAIAANQSTSEKNKNNFLIDDVYAAENTVDCYYFYKKATETTKQQGEDINWTGHSQVRADANKGFLHIKFWNYPADPNSSGERKPLATSSTQNRDNAKYSYTIVRDNRTQYYQDFLKSNLYIVGTHYKDGWNTTCPHIISGGNAWYNAKTGKTDSWETEKSGIVGGWHSHNAMVNALKTKAVMVGSNENIANFSELQSENDYINDKRSGNGNSDLLDGVKPQAIRFGQNTMGSFLQCSKDKDDECDGLIANSLTTSAGNDAVVNAIDQKTMTMDFMIGLIAAVGIAIWLIIMCVDVIVRRFKLILLQIIAPIPIISYSDPKDKMFSQWAKMYMTVYADLFLKLIAIGFATALLENIGYTLSGKGLLVFFYIVAILVFAKVLPSLLSELFGFKMGNSFKDITGMGKAALGFGAGAVAGAAVGAYTGQGLGRLTGFASGALRGAGSGSAGNITGGAKSIAAVNTLKKQGLNWFDRMRYQGLGALGIDPNLSERAELDQIKQARAQVGNINSRIGDLESSVDRTPEVDAFKRAITNGVISDPTGDKLKAIRAAYASAYDSYGKVDDQGNSTQISQIGFSDVRSKINENEWKAVYGDTDKNLKVSHNAWGSGYRDAKRSIVNAHKLVLADKESVNFINEYGGDNGKALLDFKISEDTTFDQITGADYKGNTFTPMKALEDIEAAKTQALTFADQKNPNSK